MSFVVNDAPTSGSVTAAAMAAAITDADDAETVRAATAPRTIDAMAGAGWAVVGSPVGSATAVWSGGALTLTALDGAVSEVNVGNSSSLPTGEDADASIRVDVTTGDAAAGAGGSLIWRIGTDADNSVQVQIKSNGYVVVYAWVDTSPTEILGATATGITSGQREGGQLWYRWSRRGGSLALKWGVGSAGALPTRWRTINSWTSAVALTAAAGAWQRIGLLSGAISGGYVLSVTAIRTTGQQGGAL